MAVRLGEGQGFRRIGQFEAEALEYGRPVFYFPLTGFDDRGGIRGWIDRRGMVPVTKAGEISAVSGLDVLEQIVYGMYDDMDLCLMPYNCRLGIEDIFVDRETWKTRAVFRPVDAKGGPADMSALIRRKTAVLAREMIRSADVRARGYLERAAVILAREGSGLDEAVSGLETLKRRAFRLSDAERAKLDFGDVFV